MAKTEKAKTETHKTGKSLAEFRASHDKSFIVPQKIKEGLKKLGSGWDYEVNFLKIAGLSTVDLANHRDAFADHIVLVERTKRVWCGTKDLANKLREMAA